MKWTRFKLGDVLKYEQPTKYIVESANYDNRFPTPVLTAGKSFVLGYTNEKGGIFSEVPVIIFDDFTTAIKFVDFPFKVKSSAMKILKVDKNTADIKFLFYRMQRIKIDCLQHKRYWISKYSQLQIPLPILPEQKRIADILDKADALRKKNKEILEQYDLLAQSIFLEMFGDPVRNPKGWEKKKLGSITTLVTDGKHGNCNDEKNSGYYFISAKDVNNGVISYRNVRQIPKKEFTEVDQRTNLQPGDLVMVNTGATIGKMAIAANVPETRKTTFQKSVAVIKTNKEILTSVFLKYVFMLRLNTFVNKGSGSAIKNLLLSEMKRFEIILPEVNLQNQFATIIQNIEKQKELAKQSLMESQDLFNGLLQSSVAKASTDTKSFK